MKIFNFGACTSSETQEIKKEIKSINEQIKSIKPQTNATKLTGLAETINAIKSRVKKLDAKHQAKVTNSSGYASMTRSSCSINTTLNKLNKLNDKKMVAQAAQAAQAASKNAEATLELEKMFEKDPSLRKSTQLMINSQGAAYTLAALKSSRECQETREIQKAKNIADAQSALNERQNKQARRHDWT